MKKIYHRGLLLLPPILLLALILPAYSPDSVSSPASGLTANQITPSPTPEVKQAKGSPWIFIQGGKFLMGSLDTDPGANKDEKPQHYVVLSGFFIMRNEVTNGEFATCVKAGKCGKPSTAKTGPLSHYNDPNYSEFPVVGINWNQAVAYCTFIQGRLPTEAEWEKAARGKEDLPYPWGDKPATCDLLNFKNCKNDIVQVSSYAGGVSPYKIADISGNVAEWVADWYDPNFYGNSPLVSFSPTGPKFGAERVVRGGSWMEDATFARTAARTKQKPDKSGPDTGFRCVASAVMAPMCSSGGYRNFCQNPGTPPPKNCVPGQPPVTEGGCTFKADGSVTCDGNNDNVAIQTPGSGFSGTLPGFTCTTSDGKITCTGTKQNPGTALNVTVCGPAAVTYVPKLYDVLLAAYNSPLMKTTSTAGINCPPGYTPNYSNMPPTCVPDPNGYPQGSLVPDGSCPQGYLLNKAIGCCVPGLGNPCPKGEYTRTGLASECMPVDPFGCVAPQVPDGMGNCIDDPNYTPPANPGECPDGFTKTDLGCVDNGVAGINVNCLANDIGYDGQCTQQPTAGNQCSEGDAKRGYVNTPQGCKPGYGPGSGCPGGYRLLPGSLCCTPIPGYGSYCGTDTSSAYDSGSDTCLYGNQEKVDTSCKDFPGTLWDEKSQMCLPLGNDCCPDGQVWSMDAMKCVPTVFGDGKATECGDAYTLVDGYCYLKQAAAGTQPKTCCASVSLKAPCCYSSCQSGYTLNPSTHCCDRVVNPCAGVPCGTYPACGGCCHVGVSPGGGKICVHN